MRTFLSLILSVSLGACGRMSDAQELASVKQARSVASEWALVNLQLDRNQVSERYAAEMRASARDQLQSVGRTFADPNSAQAAEVRALLGLADDAPPPALRIHVAKLKRIEDSLESA